MESYNYSISETNNDLLSEDKFVRDLRNNESLSLNNPIGITASNKSFNVYFEVELSIEQETELNSIVSSHDGQRMPTPVIYSHCKHTELVKNAVDVDYVKKMDSTLFKDVSILKNGFVERTTYYLNYENGIYSNPVIRVESNYNVINDSSVESAKSLSDKVKKWSVYLDDGTFANPSDEFYGWYKLKARPYTSSERSSILNEGYKRRGNIETQLSVELTYLFIQMGVATGSSLDEMIANAENVLIGFLGYFAKAMQLWYKTGRGSDAVGLPNIYMEVANVSILTFPWIDNMISPALSMAIPDVVKVSENTTIRNYIIGRLEGSLI